MKKLDIKFFLILLCSLFLCVCSSKALAQTAENSTGYKMIPIQQWEQLKSNSLQLELKLEEVKLQLEMLSEQSSEVKAKLMEAEKQLMISKQELENSNLSLASAKDLQQKARESLTELTNQIEAEREKNQQIQDKLRVQRTIAWIVAGLFFISK